MIKNAFVLIMHASLKAALQRTAKYREILTVEPWFTSSAVNEHLERQATFFF